MHVIIRANIIRHFRGKGSEISYVPVISVDSTGLIPRVSKLRLDCPFPATGVLLPGILRPQPSQNSPHLAVFSPLLRSEGRNIEMEALSGRVWLQIFRNNHIALCAMIPQVLVLCATHPFALQPRCPLFDHPYSTREFVNNLFLKNY